MKWKPNLYCGPPQQDEGKGWRKRRRSGDKEGVEREGRGKCRGMAGKESKEGGNWRRGRRGWRRRRWRESRLLSREKGAGAGTPGQQQALEEDTQLLSVADTPGPGTTITAALMETGTFKLVNTTVLSLPLLKHIPTSYIIGKDDFYQDILAYHVINVYRPLFIAHYLIKIIVLISLLKWLIGQVLKEINTQKEG